MKTLQIHTSIKSSHSSPQFFSSKTTIFGLTSIMTMFSRFLHSYPICFSKSKHLVSQSCKKSQIALQNKYVKSSRLIKGRIKLGHIFVILNMYKYIYIYITIVLICIFLMNSNSEYLLYMSSLAICVLSPVEHLLKHFCLLLSCLFIQF